MTTNREWLYSLDVADLSDWFDAEHVDNARSAKRAAAVERLRGMTLNTGSAIKKLAIALDVRWNPDNAPLSMAVLQNALIELLTDDDGLRNNDGVAAEHGATRMTNLERLFVDSEQFRQAVSAFAFAHSDDCPTSPTQMVDWLMAPYVGAQSKAHSKTEQMLTEQSESLSDDLGHPTDMSQKSADCVRNDGKMSETGVSASDVDANDENATQDSREKLEADVSKWCLSHAYGDTGYTFIIKQLNRQAEITRKTEQAAWIQQANGLIHEANVRADELRDELAKRDKGIARLKRQRDTARAKIDELEAECDTCVYKQEFRNMDKLEAERDSLATERDEWLERYEKQTNRAYELIAERDLLKSYVEDATDDYTKLVKERDALAHDLRDCEQQRERLRQALGCAIDHAHEIVSLVTIDGEVIG